MNGSVKHIFVGGSLRSGTSLLQKVICSSTDTNPFINGCRYLTDQLGVYAQYIGVDNLYIDDYFGNTSKFREFTKGVIENILAETWACTGRPDALVLKSPEMSFYIPHLADLLPGAKFVISVREPKDTITSMIKVGERQRKDKLTTNHARIGRNIDALCTMFNNYYLPTLKNLEVEGLNLKKRVLFVKYEDIVCRPDETLAKVSRFCGISVGRLPESGDWRVSKCTEKISRHVKWRTYVTDLSSKPISKDSIGAYKSVLTAAECATVDDRCQAIRKTFDYP